MNLDERDDCTVVSNSLFRYRFIYIMSFGDMLRDFFEGKITTYKIFNLRVGAIRHL